MISPIPEELRHAFSRDELLLIIATTTCAHLGIDLKKADLHEVESGQLAIYLLSRISQRVGVRADAMYYAMRDYLKDRADDGKETV